MKNKDKEITEKEKGSHPGYIVTGFFDEKFKDIENRLKKLENSWWKKIFN